MCALAAMYSYSELTAASCAQAVHTQFLLLVITARHHHSASHSFRPPSVQSRETRQIVSHLGPSCLSQLILILQACQLDTDTVSLRTRRQNMHNSYILLANFPVGAFPVAECTLIIHTRAEEGS